MPQYFSETIMVRPITFLVCCAASCCDTTQVCQRVAPIFEAEPRTVLLQSPVYVFGDIHGNLEASLSGAKGLPAWR